jgi:hypothetical protein
MMFSNDIVDRAASQPLFNGVIVKRVLVSLAVLSMVAVSSAAVAHHSGAMFDRSKRVTIVGTLKELQWVNPHAWIEVVGAPDGSGAPVQWSFELGGGGGSLRGMGMTRTNPKAGDKVVIIGYPLRDGRTGASFISMTANGKTYSVSPVRQP